MNVRILELFNNNVGFTVLIRHFSVEQLLSVKDKEFMIYLFSYFSCSGSSTDHDDFVIDLNGDVSFTLNHDNI